MTKKSSLMSKFMVLLLAFAVVFTYSVMPMNQAYAASAKKPAKVTIKTAKAASASSVKVTWKKAKNAKKYQVYASTKKSSGFKKVATTSKTAVTVKKLKAGTKYYFKVRGLNGKTKGAFGKVKAATTKKKVVEKDATLGAVNARTMTISIDMTDEARYPQGHAIELWVPVPCGDDCEPYQTVKNFKIVAEKAAVKEFTVENNSGWHNQMAHIIWDSDTIPADRVAEIKFDVKRYAVSRPDPQEDTKAAFSAEAKKFLGKTGRVDPEKEIVKKYAKIAAGDAKTNLDKAENIYNWIINNLERLDIEDDLGNGVKFTNDTGCGKGDPADLLENFEKYGRWGGHCTDLNSCFVGLCRAAGVPAREMFGIRMGDTASDGQHCWAEFYVPGEGWTYADPGDVLKEARKVTSGDRSKEAIEAARKADSVLAKKKELWCGVENNRVVLSRGRDVVLEPAQKEGPRNTFGYPYAEMDGMQKDAKGEVIDCTKYKDFKYTVTCTETPVVVTASEVAANDGGMKLLDLRQAKDYAIGHVPGAVSADVNGAVSGSDAAAAKTNVEAAIAGDPDGKKYVLLCYSGNAYANAGRKILLELGIKNDNILILGQDDGTQGPNGGMKAWTAAGYDMVPVVEAVAENTVYVTPDWVRSAQAGEQKGYENIVICEVSYNINRGSNRANYESGHIPGAIPVSVVEVEDPDGNEGAYNLLDAETVKANLLKHGITSDTKVVLYSRNSGDLGVHRQAYAYLWCGVKDVKVLDGNLPLWTYNLETTSNEGKETAATDFGVSVPAHPEYWTSIEDARAKADSDLTTYDPNFKLVSIRAENEWLGVNSGYDYIDFAGEPKGAVWGKGANGAYDVAQFLNEDGTVKSLDGFKEVWKDCDFKTDDSQHLAFYCGTGWRATVPFLVLYENGYQKISVYDGGWWEWLFGKTGDYDITKAVRSNLDYPVQVWNAEKNAFDYTTVGDLPAGKAAK